VRDPRERRIPSVADVLLYLLGIAGVAAGITITFLGMRAVMEVGGSCADGGPYVSAQPCPEGVALATLVGILGGIASLFLAAWKGTVIGDGATSVLFLAWPALFGALGLNFLLYGLDPPGDEPGWAWGWLICGVVFWAMALAPLLVRGAAARAMAPAGSPGRALSTAAPTAGVEPGSGAAIVEAPLGAGPSSVVGVAAADVEALVDGLERLAALHRTGALTDDEYARAKVELLERAWS
jgi:hypothetical protein